jgi:hypothetical protein
MPKKKQKRRTKRFRGINVTDAALGYAGVSIWSNALLQVDPIEFFTSKTGGSYPGSFKITGRELIDSLMGGTGGVYSATASKAGVAQNAFGAIQRNAMVNGPTALVQSVALGVGGTIGKRVTRKPRAFLNKQLRNFGLGDMIRF